MAVSPTCHRSTDFKNPVRDNPGPSFPGLSDHILNIFTLYIQSL